MSGIDEPVWTPTERAALARLGLDDAPEADVTAFLRTARTLGLDPFALGQIHLVGRPTSIRDDDGNWTQTVTRWSVQIGLDGWRLLARRAATAAGARFAIAERAWCGDDGRWRDVWLTTEAPAAARVIVLRDGEPFPGVATLAESAARNRRGDLVALWRTKPATMLAKTAEVAALRAAFPIDLPAYTAQASPATPRAALPAPESHTHVISPPRAPEALTAPPSSPAVLGPELDRLHQLARTHLAGPAEYANTVALALGTVPDRTLTETEARQVADLIEHGTLPDLDGPLIPEPTTGEDRP